MKKSIKKGLSWIGVSMFTIAFSCTNLDEKKVLYDQVTSDNFYKNSTEVTSAVAAAYTNLYGFCQNNNQYALNEVTSDEIVVPTRGADWGDGGHWVRLKLHTWTNQDSRIQQGWDFNFAGVVNCNRLLYQLSFVNTDAAKAYVPELKALRAIYYLWLLDLYGNVPITTDFTNTEAPANNTRKEVYNFIESELTSNMASLPKTGPADASTYGRVNYYTAQFALIRLYLNAEIYIGVPQWDKAIAACDEIINSGLYSLTANYKENFAKENKGVSEAIWSIPYDEVFAQGNQFDMITLHMQNQSTYKMTSQPWNGFASVEEFYGSYIDPSQNPGPQGTVVGLDPLGTPTTGTLDSRLSNFLVGPQFSSDNVTRLTDSGAEQDDPDGLPLTFTPYINELQPAAWRQSGARIGKWEFYQGMSQFMSNDFIIYRYADVLLQKAEALARKNGYSDQVALSLVNQIRTRAGVTAFTSLDADKLLAERGREMFSEAVRRTDLIRFGKFNDAWRFHPADADQHVNLFPIPYSQTSTNKKLTQNPGY